MSSIYKSANGRVTVQAAYDKLLSQLPADIEQHYVTTSQGPTFVLAAGKLDAPPLVFFHGSLSNSITWRWELTRLAPKFRVYAIDMIGEAGKSAEARPSLHSDAYSQWLREVFQQLGVTQPILVGLSLGGWLALPYATHFPADVKGLILLSPGGVGQNRNVLLWALPYLLLGKWGVKRFHGHPSLAVCCVFANACAMSSTVLTVRQLRAVIATSQPLPTLSASLERPMPSGVCR